MRSTRHNQCVFLLTNGFEFRNQSSGRDAFSAEYQSNRDFYLHLINASIYIERTSNQSVIHGENNYNLDDCEMKGYVDGVKRLQVDRLALATQVSFPSISDRLSWK